MLPIRLVPALVTMVLLLCGVAQAADPEARWPLDTTAGQITPDASANGLDAELRFGAALVGGGRFGDALDPAETQASTSGAWAPSSPALEPGRLSLVAWVKRTGSPGAYRYIAAKGANACNGPSYALYANGSGRLQFVVSNGAAGRVSAEAPATLWDGAWHAVTGTWDGSDARLYVDGALVPGPNIGSGTLGYGLPVSAFTVGTYPAADQCAFNTGWPGLVDDVRVYSRTLTGADIAYLHDRRHAVPPSLPIPPPVVQTTGADELTVGSARISGAIDDRLAPRTWHVEYGETTSYGARTPDVTTAGAVGSQPVQAVLAGLAPGTTYHARVVADGVAGGDISFRTSDADVAAASVPAGLDFTWNPRADVLIAGAPAGGVQFDATAAPGVTYLWDFDYRAADGFRPDPGASGPSPRHAFTADGAHDTDRVKGGDGTRRRVYRVRLRALAPDGTTAEAEHELVVMPNGAPVVDIVTRRPTLTVSTPVTFIPRAADPDAGPRTADRLVRLEWDLDTPAGNPGDPAATDIVCDGAGASCTGPDGTPLGDWFSAGPSGAISVNFFTRGLAANRLRPLAQIDLGALPERGPDGSPLTGALAIQSFQGRGAATQKDLRLAYLYDNATLLQQSTFNTDAGEATGAQLAKGSLRAKGSPRAKGTLKPASIIRQEKFLASAGLSWRRVTLTATDSAGVRTSTTKVVPLVPDAAPRLKAKFLNLDPRRRAIGLANPQIQPRERARARAAAGEKQELGYTLTTEDELVFDAFATDDPDGRIAWYTLEVGQPLRGAMCQPKPQAESTRPPLIPTPEEYRPGGFQPQVNPAGAGIAGTRGRVGDIAAKGPNSRKVSAFRAAGAPDRPLSALLAQSPLLHACAPFTQRNVDAQPFLVRPSAASRPVTRGAINKQLLQPRGDRTFPTSAIVTKDPNDLRFTIPVAGTYSVAIGAYDESGLGAIQRTDGLKIFDAEGDCVNVSGEPLTLAGRKLGFGGQCLSFSDKRTRFRTTQEISLNGVGLRPRGGGVVRIDTVARTLRVTRGESTDAAGDVEVVVDGDVVAQISDFTPARANDFVRGDLHPTVIAGARYRGSPLARPTAPGPDPDNFLVTFGSAGTSTTRFFTVLPGEFSRSGESTSPTSEVRRRGREEPRSNELTTNRFAEIASKRPRARAAADANSSTLDLSGTNLGPVSIDQGKLSFDPERGYWEGNLDVTLNVASPVTGLSMHLVIDDGELKEASGRAKTLIPLFAGVTLDELRFSIVSDPLTVSGGASASIIKVLRGDLDMTIRTGPVFFRLTGRISLFNEIELGSAYVQYDEANAESLTFGGQLGLDFGPVSIGAGVDGGVSFKTGDFFVEGNGRACLFICLGVKALISNKALAACGSIDLLFVEVSAGFAYRFGDGLEVFLGCDLAPYRPAVFRVRGGVTADAAQAGAAGLRVPAGAEQAAFRFRGNAGMAGAPKLTLTAPDGRTFTTGDLPGDYTFTPRLGAGVTTPTAVIDQDPVSKLTTILVAKPPAGDWKVTLAPGQPPLVGAEIALGEHVEDKELRAEVRDADLEGDTVKIGSAVAMRASSSRASTAATKLARLQVAALRQQPRIERSRFRGVVLDVPDGLSGSLVLADVTPASTAIVRKLDLETYGGKKVPIAFRPTADPGTHELRALLTHSDGTPRQSILVDTFAGPPMPVPTAPDLSLSRSSAGTVVVDVRPGSAGPVREAASSFDLVVQAPSGRRIERLVDRSNSRRLPDGAFRVTLGTFSASDFRGLRTWGRMVYAGKTGAIDSARAARR